MTMPLRTVCVKFESTSRLQANVLLLSVRILRTPSDIIDFSCQELKIRLTANLQLEPLEISIVGVVFEATRCIIKLYHHRQHKKYTVRDSIKEVV